MTETCPFCGMREDIFSYNPEDYCRWVGKYADDFKGLRSVSCYERQLAQQADMLREAKKVVELLAWCGCNCESEYKMPLPGNDPKENHTKECIVGKAQALLPKLEAMVKEKP